MAVVGDKAGVSSTDEEADLLLEPPLESVDPGGEEELYTLRQAAQMLNIDYRTLQKRLQHAHIKPIQDSIDRRLRLITRSQLEMVSKSSRRSSAAPQEDTVKDLQRKVRELQKTVSDLQKTVDALHQSQVVQTATK